MDAIAHLKYAKIAPRKARVVVGLIRGKMVTDAVDMLKFTKRSAAPLVAKLLESAIANAKQKDPGVNLDNVFVQRAWVNQAPNSMMRRWRPRAMGRATRIAKGVSHITLVLASKDLASKEQKARA